MLIDKGMRLGSIELKDVIDVDEVSDLAAAKLDLNELVHRAESALASVPTSGDGEAVVGFDDLQPPNRGAPPH